MLWDWLQSSSTRFAQDTGPDWKELVPLARRGFLSPWIPGGPSYSPCWGKCVGHLTYDLELVRAPGSQASSGYCGTGNGASLIRALAQTGRLQRNLSRKKLHKI